MITRNVPVITLLVFIAQDHCEELSANHTGDVQESIHKLAEKLVDKLADQPRNSMDEIVDKLIDNLFEQQVRSVWSLHHSDLDNTTLGSPGHLAIPLRTSLRNIKSPVPLLAHPRFNTGDSASHWTGSRPQFRQKATVGQQAQDLSKSVKASPSTKRRRSRDEWATLLRLSAPDWPLFIGAFIALALAATGEALLPALKAAALNAALGLDAVHAGASSDFWVELTRLGLVGAATIVCTGARGFLFWVGGARAVVRLRKMLFSALLCKSQAFHDQQGQGELTSRLAADCSKLGDVLSFNMNVVLRQLLQSIVGISIVLSINAPLAGLVLIGVAFRAISSVFFAKINRQLAEAKQDALAASSGVAEQCISLIKVVRSHGNEAHEDMRYGKQLDQLLNLETRMGAWYGCSRLVNDGLNMASLIGVLGLGGVFVVTGLLPKEALTTFLLYVTFISQASADVAENWGRIQEALGAVTSVFDYLEPQTLDSATNNTNIVATSLSATSPPLQPARLTQANESDHVGTAAKRGALAFDGVEFAYPSRPTSPVIEEFSLSVDAGEQVAIVGGSGSGKSTVFMLLLRFYQPTIGKVTLDGVPLDCIDKSMLRSSIAWVQQEPPLFTGVTIRENIAYGLGDVPDEKIEAAAKEANAFEFIQQLPKGFDTRIGAGGVLLSGGQKQRVALARALVRDPALLLLDEATSALDPESERLVEAAIRRASERRTVLFTTHKVKQAQYADRIIVMSHGKIVEEGTHGELLECNGAYAGLLLAGDNLSEDSASTVVDLTLKKSECSV